MIHACVILGAYSHWWIKQMNGFALNVIFTKFGMQLKKSHVIENVFENFLLEPLQNGVSWLTVFG